MHCEMSRRTKILNMGFIVVHCGVVPNKYGQKVLKRPFFLIINLCGWQMWLVRQCCEVNAPLSIDLGVIAHSYTSSASLLCPKKEKHYRTTSKQFDKAGELWKSTARLSYLDCVDTTVPSGCRKRSARVELAESEWMNEK